MSQPAPTTVPPPRDAAAEARRRRASASWLGLVLVLHLLLGLMYDRATPIFEAPDEGYHFAFARWLSLGHGLPVQQPGQLADWEQEGSQPPLYYLLVSGLTGGIDTSDWNVVFVHNPFVRNEPGTEFNANAYRHRLDEGWPYQGTVLAVHLARWVSLLLSLFTIFFTYRLALLVFPDRDMLALLAASFVAFIPQVLFINASVNNDNLLMALSTAALFVSLGLMQAKVSRFAWRAALLGLLLGLAALTKVSGLVLWPVAAGAVAWGAWRGRDWKRFVFGGLIIAVIALLVCGWWYWRNEQLYGDWLGLSTMLAIAGPRVPRLPLNQLILEEWYGFFLSFWAVFGVFTILPAGWVFGFYGLLTLWAISGIWVASRANAGLRPEFVALAIFCLLTLIGVVNWTLQTPASQGRLMYGAIGPLAIFLATGILSATRPLLHSRAGHNWSSGLVLTLASGLALVAAVVPPAYISPHYAPPTLETQAQIPADLHPVDVTIAGKIQMLGYTVPITPVVPGLRQPVTLYWRALAPMSDDYVLALHMLGRGGSEVTHLDTWPGGGNGPTSQWVPGSIYADTYLLPINAHADTPSQLSLALYFWDDDDPYTALPMTTAAGQPVPSVIVPAGRLVDARSVERPPQHLDGSTFDDGIQLQGYEASDDTSLHLKLYWRLTGRVPVPANYTVFLHLTDAQGAMVTAPADGPPLGGDWPTADWVPGQTVVDTRSIPLPAQLPAGQYDLQLGFYDPVTGDRLAAYKPDGTPWPDSIVVLSGIVRR